MCCPTSWAKQPAPLEGWLGPGLSSERRCAEAEGDDQAGGFIWPSLATARPGSARRDCGQSRTHPLCSGLRVENSRSPGLLPYSFRLLLGRLPRSFPD